MAKLLLKFKESLIKEIVLQNRITSIGRTDNNDIQIDNLAVSGSHARIIGDGDTFIIEDLNSTNGTYVNESRISRQLLLHDSVITIGKHSLVFLDPVGSNSAASAAQAAVMMKNTGRAEAPKVIDQPKQTSMDQTIVVRGVLPPLQPLKVPTAEKVGVLTVLNGSDRGTEHLLSMRLTTIGKSAQAEIRLRGFFAPKVAALIKKTSEGYFITPSSRWRKLLVNGIPASKDHPLRPADIVEIASLRVQFSLRNG
jgi:pSer/pThr/pTyr-binding forkhead associated (FHA) protein